MPASFLEVVAAVSEDERFADWELGDGDDNYREIRRDRVVLVLAAPELWQDPHAIKPHWVRARSGNYTLILCGEAAQLDAVGPVMASDELASASVLQLPVGLERLAVEMSSVFGAHRYRLELADRELAIERARYERDLLIDVGRFLSQERNINALLQRILTKARAVTGADAGSVYIVEGDDDDPADRTLHFVASQNDSRSIESGGFTMAVSPSSIVGACVLSGDVINIPDLYSLDQPGTGNNPWGFIHDRTWDQQIAYETRSMLTVPMISARGEVIGVIQLINKRARGVVKLTRSEDFKTSVLTFDTVSINYADTLASQAGIALENALLYNEVQVLFEGFVHASVTAIEARDPTTSGHSERVADLTVGLAEAADRADGVLSEIYYTGDEIKQIKYAALLHDFGKVGVREHVLVKAKKLYPYEKSLIEARFHFIRKCVEAEALEAKVRYAMEASRDDWQEAASKMDGEASQRVDELDDYVSFILKANEPSLLEEGGFERLSEIAERNYVSPSGETCPYLTRDEVEALQISRGSLTAEERAEIESHVVHSYNFLKQIPWGRTFRDVPEIAGSHHEKLDGSGYPLGLEAHEIPTPTKMMTIADIFDALTASDRPYKRAVPLEMALDILKSEVDRGKVDGDLFKLFIDAQIWTLVLTP